MDVDVKAVLLTMGFAALLAVVSLVVGWMRQRAEQALTREAQADLLSRSHRGSAATMGAGVAAHQLAGSCGGVGQPQDAVAAGEPPSPAVTATQMRRAS